MIDVVYVLGNGSKWEDKEFCHSLRTVHKRLKNFRRVIVIGNMPRSVNPETPAPHYIPFADRDGCKQKNVRKKLMRVCAEPAITEEFLLMNDDFFFLKDVDALTLPHYRMGTLAQHIEHRQDRPSAYLESMKHTKKWLDEKGLPSLDFEIHVPIRYDKANLSRVLTEFNWSQQRGGLIRSLYCNLRGIEGTVLSDLKIVEPLSMAEITRRTAGRNFFSVGDGGLHPELKNFLNSI